VSPSFIGSKTAILLLAITSRLGCTKFIANSSSGLFRRAQPAIEQHWDYEMAGSAAPVGIIQLEGILHIVPKNSELLILTIGAYLGYALGWVEDELEQADAADDFDRVLHLRSRARGMYTRAWELGRRLLNVHAKGFDAAAAGGVDSLSQWLEDNFHEEDDAEVLLLAAQAWAQHIIFNAHDITLITDIPLAKVMLERSVELGPEFYFMQGKVVLAVVASQELPPDMDKSKALFEEVLAGTERHSLIVQVTMARFYAVADGDYELFRDLLQEVIDAGDVLPEARLMNVIARRRAERYLSRAPYFFSELVESSFEGS